MIKLENVTKRFGDLVAVDSLDLHVPAGELFAILGPNAAGKTTTIKLITGLIQPTQGRVLLAGRDVQQEPIEARRRLAYVPDFPFLYDKLTPWEFFRFIGELFRMDRKRIEAAAGPWIERFSLEPYLHETIESLSHGTKQRIAIAAGLMHDPQVFVLDEPMVGLDPHHAKALKDTLRELAARGTAIFISTHQLSVAEDVADRIGIMHRGRLAALGSPEELRRQAGVSGALEQVFLRITEEEQTAAGYARPGGGSERG
ncbi:MAG: ABC transporter ATP-binding protein [Verrucomicrobia bacterium]|nr:ABC transporter ATP-binding protein [Verrucomicrobiota bacterium]